MIEFGKSLRTAREAKGLSLSQLAERTHILSQIVDGLEKEDFSQIVAPIYGRGFVKLYCEAVGLEPKPFIEQFMLLYNGTVTKDGTPSPTATAPATTPVHDVADMTATSVAAPKLHFHLNARLLTIAIAAVIMLLLLASGLRALYHATAVDPADPAAEEIVAEPTAEKAVEPPATPTPGAPRQQLPVKPFYAD